MGRVSIKISSEISLNPISKVNPFFSYSGLLDGNIGNPQLRAACLAVYGFALLDRLAANGALAQKLAAATFTGRFLEVRS